MLSSPVQFLSVVKAALLCAASEIFLLWYIAGDMVHVFRKHSKTSHHSKLL